MNYRACVVASFFVVLIAIAAGSSLAQDQSQSLTDQSAAEDPRADDRAAIRKMFDLFADAVEARDAKALASKFTVEGEFRNVDGVKVRGRSALEKAFSDLFAEAPELAAQVQSDSLRFLSGESAIDEGQVVVARGPVEATKKSRYEAFVVREAGAWRLAAFHEMSSDNGPSIDDLGWLIGQWRSVNAQGAEIQTTYSWHPGKKFIRMEFKIKESELTASGTQIIGVDPATGLIHSWTFEANGGIGEADWYRDDDHWVLDAAGTFADGGELVETNVLRRIDNDTFTWQSTNRMLGDNPLADLPPVKVSRVKVEP